MAEHDLLRDLDELARVGEAYASPLPPPNGCGNWVSAAGRGAGSASSPLSPSPWSWPAARW